MAFGGIVIAVNYSTIKKKNPSKQKYYRLVVIIKENSSILLCVYVGWGRNDKVKLEFEKSYLKEKLN